jgi:hypothetical protein
MSCDGTVRPLVYTPSLMLKILWNFTYWIPYVLCWTVFPIMMSYSTAGGFSIFDRLRVAVVGNLIFYGVAGTVMVVLLVYVLIAYYGQVSFANIRGVAVAFSNAYGLVLYILLMGYGVVEIPRMLWREGNLRVAMKHCEYRVVNQLEDMQTAKAELRETLRFVKAVELDVDQYDPFYKEVQIIVSKCPPEYSTVTKGDVVDFEVTRRNLVNLHTNLKSKVEAVDRTTSMYHNTLREAFKLYDILHTRDESESWFGSLSWTFGHRWAFVDRTIAPRIPLDRLEYVWHVYMHPIGSRVLALFCAMMSITLVWSEMMLFVGEWIDLSVWSKLVKLTDTTDLGIFFFVFLPLCYMCVCTYWALFKIRIFNYYRLIPYASSAASMLFAALYLCRLNAPLAYNFFMVIRGGSVYKSADGSIMFCNPNVVHENACTEFELLMGDMASVPFIGGRMNVYLPFVLMVIVVVTLLNLYSRVMAVFNLRYFQFDDDFDDSQIDEGRMLIERERSKRLRVVKKLGAQAAESYDYDVPEPEAFEMTTPTSPGGAKPAVGGGSEETSYARRISNFFGGGSGSGSVPATDGGGGGGGVPSRSSSSGVGMPRVSSSSSVSSTASSVRDLDFSRPK